MLREAPCGTVACSQPARETSTAADREVINLLMAYAPSPEGIGAALETERPGRRVSAKTRPGAAPLHGPYATDSPKALSTRVRIFYHFYVIHITHGIFQRPGAEPADAQLHSAHARLERAEERLARIDFCASEAKSQAAAALAGLKASYQAMYPGGEPRASKRGLRQIDPARYQKRLWATRQAPWVDRLASAWLIKRFIDREARFAWIARPSECPKKAVGFDFDGAEFTHVKNRVTFEVLLASFGLDGDSALAAIGASVHYLDVGGIPVADAKGLETVLKGIKEKARDDDALLAEAMRILDLFYSAYRQDKKD